MNIKSLWAKVVLKNYVIAGASLSLLSAVLILLFKGILPPQVPLFYGLPVGEARLASTLGFLIAPGVSFLIVIINTLASVFVSDLFYKKTLIISSFFVSILVIITVLKVIFLVGTF
jgi:hypothetical protein